MASSSSKVSDLFDELEELHLQSLTWEPDSVNIVVAKSYESRDDSECVTIDLLKTLETGKRCPKPNQRNNTNVYYLPPSFNVNTAEFRKEVLIRKSSIKKESRIYIRLTMRRAVYIYGAVVVGDTVVVGIMIVFLHRPYMNTIVFCTVYVYGVRRNSTIFYVPYTDTVQVNR